MASTLTSQSSILIDELLAHPKPQASAVKTVITRPRRVSRAPVVICGLVALAFATGAVLKSPLVAPGTVKRAAIAIHEFVFEG